MHVYVAIQHANASLPVERTVPQFEEWIAPHWSADAQSRQQLASGAALVGAPLPPIRDERKEDGVFAFALSLTHPHKCTHARSHTDPTVMLGRPRSYARIRDLEAAAKARWNENVERRCRSAGTRAAHRRSGARSDGKEMPGWRMIGKRKEGRRMNSRGEIKNARVSAGLPLEAGKDDPDTALGRTAAAAGAVLSSSSSVSASSGHRKRRQVVEDEDEDEDEAQASAQRKRCRRGTSELDHDEDELGGGPRLTTRSGRQVTCSHCGGPHAGFLCHIG